MSLQNPAPSHIVLMHGFVLLLPVDDVQFVPQPPVLLGQHLLLLDLLDDRFSVLLEHLGHPVEEGSLLTSQLPVFLLGL